MKLISWNVNGLRACVGKGFMDFFREADADIFCIQESKLQERQIEGLPLEGYHQYWNYAEKKGYSGTALFTKKEPLQVTYGIGIEEYDREGRVITAEYEDLYVVTVYTPNSQQESCQTFLSHDVGKGIFRLYQRTEKQKIRCILRRSECGTSGDRSEKSEDKSPQCRLYG